MRIVSLVPSATEMLFALGLGSDVIAVTHDEKYWHLADRVIKFDLGRIAWERPGADVR